MDVINISKKREGARVRTLWNTTFNLMIVRGQAVTFNILFATCEVTTDSFWCFFLVAREIIETFTATKKSYPMAKTVNLTKT